MLRRTSLAHTTMSGSLGLLTESCELKAESAAVGWCRLALLAHSAR